MSKRTNAHDRDAHRVGIRLHDLFSRLAASPPNTDHSDLYVEGDSLINEICAYSRLAGLSEGLDKLEKIYGYEAEIIRRAAKFKKEMSDA